MSESPSDFCRWDGPDLLLEVRVIPRARETAVAGLRAGRLLIRLQAPPAEGKANAALERYLARLCGVSRGAVTIEAGETARDKRVRITRPGTLPTLPTP
ncbi:MAG: DUF167 family protein [Halofilum sp. (in: g-proteobacteria)]